ncbi:hypothetical protein GN956_G8254 [Arapaima gigas]
MRASVCRPSSERHRRPRREVTQRPEVETNAPAKEEGRGCESAPGAACDRPPPSVEGRPTVEVQKAVELPRPSRTPVVPERFDRSRIAFARVAFPAGCGRHIMTEETLGEELSIHDIAALTEDTPPPPGPRSSLLSLLNSGRRFSTEQLALDLRLEDGDFVVMDERFQLVEYQFQCLLDQANDLQKHLIRSRPHFPKEAFVHVVPAFLDRCKPYFTYFELKARSYRPQHRSVPIHVRNWLLGLTQKLCLHLEKLIVVYASLNILSMDESDPCGFSHFYIGQCVMGPFKVSMFRYCQPTPFLADDKKGPAAGPYKRMRWNIEMVKKHQDVMHDDDEEEDKTRGCRGPDYYFMCYEDLPWVKAEGSCRRVEDQKTPLGGMMRMWSLGQWVPTDPAGEDILDWAVCKRPKGLFKVLHTLGPAEPSVAEATDQLLGLLFSYKHSMESPEHSPVYS